jgi:hypothetical protein
MTPKVLKTIPKISVKIWPPIIKRLADKVDAACLRRDAYLSRVLAIELDRLDDEVSIPNSEASFKYVFACLEQLHGKPVSLALPSDLTRRLSEICDRKRIVRDAFFNRIFLLLAASAKDIDVLFFSDSPDNWRTEIWSENRNDGPFFQNGFYPLEPVIDPFWAIRSGIEMYSENTELEDYVEPSSGKIIRIQRDRTVGISPAESLYTIVLDRKGRRGNLLGMNCYMPDWRIPGTDAAEDVQAKTTELLADLDSPL